MLRRDPKLPKRGEYAGLNHLQDPHRELAIAVRKLCRLIGGGKLGLGGGGRGRKEGLSEVCNISRSALSALLNGKTKRPDLNILKRLYELAEGEAGAEAMPLSFEDLKGLREAVIIESSRGRHLCSARGDGQGQCSTASAAGEQVRPNLRQAAPTALPVLPVAGDRQVPVLAQWTGIRDLHARLAAGQDADAAGVLRYTGLSAVAVETAAAIATCSRAGLGEAADALIVYAARRSERDVMEIARALIGYSLSADASELLGFALAV